MKASEFLKLKTDLELLLVDENITSSADASDVVEWLFGNDLLDMERVVEYMVEKKESN